MAMTSDQRFDAFGNRSAYSGFGSTFGFAAKAQYQTDAESGLMLLGHRYYDPSLGRFISQDPAQDESNWYAYCGNNPLVKIDPDGRIAAPAIIVGAVAAVVVLAVVHTDWGSHDLSTAQKTAVEALKKDITERARKHGDAKLVKYVQSMHVTKQFNHQEGDQAGVSETKAGRLFGLTAGRTILSTDFFERTKHSQAESLIHEAYHAGTHDWSENKSYKYATKKVKELGY